jgi:uncharacterized protein YndB with AHSA1/START domain
VIKIERTITIHRPLDEVFAYLSDVEHGPQYIGGQRAAHQTSAGPMAVGATFATRSNIPGRGGNHEVTEYEQNHRLAWKTTSGAKATTTWTFQPSGPSTRVTFTRVTESTGLGRLAEPFIQQMANGSVDHDLGALKELLAVSRTSGGLAKGW